jgi:hypothetical protein
VFEGIVVLGGRNCVCLKAVFLDEWNCECLKVVLCFVNVTVSV